MCDEILTTLLKLILGVFAVPLVVADPTWRYALAFGTPEEAIGAATVGVAHGTDDAAYANTTAATVNYATVVSCKIKKNVKFIILLFEIYIINTSKLS